MIFKTTSSDLNLIWRAFIDFERFTREPDRDLNNFIEEFKERMEKVQSAGCQYSDLLLGLKLIEKVNLSHDSILSVISKLSSSTSMAESFLTQVVDNIKEPNEINGSIANESKELSNIIKANGDDEEISEQLECKTKLTSCSKCPQKFCELENLSKHYAEFHNDKASKKAINSKIGTRTDFGFLKCSICGKNFMVIENLKKHISNHDNTLFGSGLDSVFEQSFVDSSEVNQMDAATTTSNIKKEIKTETCTKQGKKRVSKKRPGKTFSCKICLKEYPKLWKVNKHMRVHRTTKNYKCPYCDNAYKWDNSLRLHLLSNHLEEQGKQKNKKSPHLDSMKEGIEDRNINSNENLIPKDENPDSSVKIQKEEKIRPIKKKPIKNLTCEICGKSFSKYGLKRHIEKTHSSKIFKCDNCPKEFSKLSVLERHIKVHNTHECSICQKICKNSSLLRFHMETHKTTRDYVCTYCGKKYKTLNVYKEHLMLHTKARPLPCSFCGKIFFGHSARVFHIRRHHTGEKPHKCDFCDKRFINPTQKTYHMRTHTGEKPFSCQVCGKSFRDPGTVSRHVKNVHKIVNPSNK